MGDFLYREESFAIIGAAMEVHKVLGCGFTEPVYQAALEQEFLLRNIPFEREKTFPVMYKGITLEKTYRVDFLCFGQVIVELKALSGFSDEHKAQVLNYLKASKLKLGLLVNFGRPSLEYKRIVPYNSWK